MCFACGYFVKPRIVAIKEKLRESAADNLLRGALPFHAREYLKRYLSNQEIDAHFTWDVRRDRLVLLDTLPGFYWGRDPTGKDPKVISLGFTPLRIFTELDVNKCRTCVIVEDPISALKVSRHCPTVPLFGAHLPEDWMRSMTRFPFANLIFWLDEDKAKQALTYALMLKNLFHTNIIVSKKDPKDYTDVAIREFIKEAEKNVQPDELIQVG
jgi:hypothetical protein